MNVGSRQKAASFSLDWQAAAGTPHPPTDGIEMPTGRSQLPTDKLKRSWTVSRSTDIRRESVVLLACGSFNPPTYAHLRMLELARQELWDSGHEVLGAYLSPVNDSYKKQGLAPAHLRVHMCQLAVQGSDLIMVDSWEAEQRQYTRTLAVLQHMQSSMDALFAHDTNIGEAALHAPPRVIFVCGADVLCSMSDASIWQQDLLEELLQQHGILCISRRGACAADLLRRPGTLLYEYRHRVRLVQDPVANEISSSLVRNEIQRGRTVKYLLPDLVLQYIYRHELYGTGTMQPL